MSTSTEHTGISVRLHSTTDAEVWAEEFAKVVTLGDDQKWDHDFLVGWFANAIETGRYAGERAADDKVRQAVKDEHDRALVGIGYLATTLHERTRRGDFIFTAADFLEIWQEGYLHGFVEDEDGS